jgi:hypothetical protein
MPYILGVSRQNNRTPNNKETLLTLKKDIAVALAA